MKKVILVCLLLASVSAEASVPSFMMPGTSVVDVHMALMSARTQAITYAFEHGVYFPGPVRGATLEQQLDYWKNCFLTPEIYAEEPPLLSLLREDLMDVDEIDSGDVERSREEVTGQ